MLTNLHLWLSQFTPEERRERNCQEMIDNILSILHLANDPDLPVSQGRFGKLTAQAAKLFFDAWTPDVA